MKMKVKQHKIRRYPLELLDMMIREYNGVTNTLSFQIKGVDLVFTLQRLPFHKDELILKLFAKVTQAIQSIHQKYLKNDYVKRLIALRIIDTNDELGLIIKGVLYLPPPSIINLFSLFLWYEITYTTGQRPKTSKEGRAMNSQWKSSVSSLKKSLALLPHQRVKTAEVEYCIYCGTETTQLNLLELSIQQQRINIEFPVCEQHYDRSFI